MDRPFTTIAAAVEIAVPVMTGAAQAREIIIGGFTGGTVTPTDDFYTTGVDSAGPGRFKARDAKTGKLIDKGVTDTKSGKYRGGSKEDVNVGTVDLPPGKYLIEVWQTDPRGNSYKAVKEITVTDTHGSESVILELKRQTPSQIAMDEANAIEDKFDLLKYTHDHALHAATIAESDKEFKNATGDAREIWEEMNALYDKYLYKRMKAARLAAMEKKTKNAAKVGEKKNDKSKAGKVANDDIGQSLCSEVKRHPSAGNGQPDVGLPARPKISDYGKDLERRAFQDGGKTTGAKRSGNHGSDAKRTGKELAWDPNFFHCDMGTSKPLAARPRGARDCKS